MNYSIHQGSNRVVEVPQMLTEFILENGIVIGVFDCINKAERALASMFGGSFLLLDDNTTGDYLLVDLTTTA